MSAQSTRGGGLPAGPGLVGRPGRAPRSMAGRMLRSTSVNDRRAGHDDAERKQGAKLHLGVDTFGLVLAARHPDQHGRPYRGRSPCQAVHAATGQGAAPTHVDQGYAKQKIARSLLPPRRTASIRRWTSRLKPSAARSQEGWADGRPKGVASCWSRADLAGLLIDGLSGKPSLARTSWPSPAHARTGRPTGQGVTTAIRAHPSCADGRPGQLARRSPVWSAG